jgi:putative hydrolase of HD superfamily
VDNERLNKQMEFIEEIDKLKNVYRQNFILEGIRNENDAEHSWHIAIMAILLSEHSTDKNIDVLKVIKMVLIHDLVEIDAGDTYCYDERAHDDKALREIKAADRIFNILPEDQTKELRSLWDEFEERETAEAKFAASLDRLQPLIHNYKSKGKSWKEHGVTSDKVLKRNKSINESSPKLWHYTQKLIKASVEKGYLMEGKEK